MRFTSIDAPLTRDGDRVVYDGTPSGDLDLQVSFAPSLPDPDLEEPAPHRAG